MKHEPIKYLTYGFYKSENGHHININNLVSDAVHTEMEKCL